MRAAESCGLQLELLCRRESFGLYRSGRICFRFLLILWAEIDSLLDSLALQDRLQTAEKRR